VSTPVDLESYTTLNEEARFWDSLNHWRKAWRPMGNQTKIAPWQLAPVAVNFEDLRAGMDALVAHHPTQVKRMTLDAKHWADVQPANGSVLAWYVLQVARDLDWPPVEVMMQGLGIYEPLREDVMKLSPREPTLL
jgi:hypothetical protein